MYDASYLGRILLFSLVYGLLWSSKSEISQWSLGIPYAQELIDSGWKPSSTISCISKIYNRRFRLPFIVSPLDGQGAGYCSPTNQLHERIRNQHYRSSKQKFPEIRMPISPITTFMQNVFDQSWNLPQIIVTQFISLRDFVTPPYEPDLSLHNDAFCLLCFFRSK